MSVSRRIFLVFVLVQAASAALVAGWYLYVLRSDLDGLTRQNVQRTVLGAIESIEEYFRPAENFAEVAHDLLAEGVVAGDRPDVLERYFVAQLRPRPQIAGLYVGYPDGAFFYVMRSDEETVGGTRTKIIRQGPEGREVELTWRDQDYKVVKHTFDPQDQYDPRERGWFSEAVESEGQVWTEPYVFFTSGNPGITLASAIRGRDGTVSAVLGIDIEMSAISGMLTRASLGVRGSAYIATAEGKVVAHSNAARVVQGGGQGGDEPRFRTVSELGGVEGALDDSVLDHVAQLSDSTRIAAWDADVEGQDYFAAAGQMENVNWPWQVVVVAPRSIGEGAAQGAGLALYSLIAIFGILACIIGYAVSRNVGRMVERLRANAKLARNGNIELMDPMDTGAPEIVETNETLEYLAMAYREKGGAPKLQQSG